MIQNSRSIRRSCSASACCTSARSRLVSQFRSTAPSANRTVTSHRPLSGRSSDDSTRPDSHQFTRLRMAGSYGGRRRVR